jgi:diguanylate cyclase (GGDEF)-like protein
MDAEIAAELLAFAEQTADFVGITDPWGHVLYLNPAARKRLGLAEDAPDLTTADIFPAEAFAIYYDVIRPQLLRSGEWSGQIPVKIADAEAVPMYVSVSARVGPGGEVNESVMYGHEPARAAPPVVAAESEIDDVTGLLTRSAFDQRARLALAAAARDGESCALVLATVFNADDAYETFHARTAATVMRALAGRLKRLSRTVDVLGRFGDDQLAVLLRGVPTHKEALRVARTVYDALVDAPVTTPGEEIVPSIGCGVGFAQPGADLFDLLEDAYEVRWHEPARQVVATPRASASNGRVDAPTMDEFRIGMSLGEVRAYARPIADLTTGLVVGYQGLARWHHRRLGLLDAAAFTDMIADTPLASQVDLYVARETAAVLTLTTRDVPLNLYAPASKQLISDVRTEQYLCEIVDAFSLGMNQLHLELPRAFMGEWGPALQDARQSLRAAELRLVITDVEQTSDAQRFADLGFDELHLSYKLTNAVATDAGARRAVSEIVGIAHDRALLVTATGVNDVQHREALAGTGCDLATGALYGGAELTSWID